MAAPIKFPIIPASDRDLNPSHPTSRHCHNEGPESLSNCGKAPIDVFTEPYDASCSRMYDC